MTENSESWGDRDFLLTKTQKMILSEWRNMNQDFTISTTLFKPIYRRIAVFVPQNIAPNIITLVGFLCILNSYYLCFRYYDVYPISTSVFSIILSFCYKILNGIDGVHAENLGNVSNVGHLFSRFCTSIGALLQTLILLTVIDIHDTNLQWYVVQIVMMVVFVVHLQGYKHGVVRYHKFFGGQELMFIFELILFLRATGMLSPLYFFYFFQLFPMVNRFLRIPPYLVINGIRYEDSIVFILFIVRILYFVLVIIVLITIIRLGKTTKKEKEEQEQEIEQEVNDVRIVPYKERINTRNSLVIIILIRCIPGILIYLNLMTELDQFDLVCDGLFMCMLVGELIVSKMCLKGIHPWMIVFSIASLLGHVLIVGMISFHYVVTIFEIASYMNLPVFSINRNVYVDGVFDMCHYGHFKYFERALRRGTRLFVGVMSDEDVNSYKRLPVMTSEERCNVVATCRSVYKVIQNAPLRCSKELIEKHNIHVVLCSEEYDRDGDHYYTIPRKMGILCPMKRTKGMSTSELIRRIERKYRTSLGKDYPHLFSENGDVRNIPELRVVASTEDVDDMPDSPTSNSDKKEEEIEIT